ncbi:unnamed protein product [Aspergillus oryzae]|nr:unnamed protein product [Aspergillus oryzae]
MYKQNQKELEQNVILHYPKLEDHNLIFYQTSPMPLHSTSNPISRLGMTCGLRLLTFNHPPYQQLLTTTWPHIQPYSRPKSTTMADDNPPKRIKLSSNTTENTTNNKSPKESPPIQDLTSLHRSITPPSPPSRSQRRSQSQSQSQSQSAPPQPVKSTEEEVNEKPRLIPSPFQLTHIRDLAASSDNNVDTVRLREILGDPMIRECWQFNYLHDVDFIMGQFDEDVRRLVKVKIVHGSWKRDAPNRAVWRSPLLPLQKTDDRVEDLTLGSGARFKRDLLAYLTEYGPKKTGPLVEQLRKYDFGAIRAALVASVPSKQKVDDLDSQKKTLWGWPALKDIMRQIPPAQKTTKATTPHIVTQTDKWLKDVMFASLSPASTSTRQPKYSIIFPTADEIRRSLNGYGSGGSIHMKLQSAAQQKQLQYMRPYLRHWAGDHDTAEPSHTSKQDAGRRRAAPHIKTYIRFSDAEKMDTIDWAMVTSANLSTQAWGAAVNASGEVRICSWEIGIVVWPQLYVQDTESATMVPTFKRDTPEPLENKDSETTPDTVIGLRMPYDLPLTPYAAHDTPWCATAQHLEPDWLGQTWTLD